MLVDDLPIWRQKFSPVGISDLSEVLNENICFGNTGLFKDVESSEMGRRSELGDKDGRSI